jgi:ParB-like chromosome segregation protein Spo0J
MKVKVSQLKPNPYRKMGNYPIDKAKVEALKTSIKEKTFWDNLLVRKLAYGHHRWQALLELGIKEIDIPVRDIDDATMVKIMAEENLNWSTSPAIMTQTILTAKEFLDNELAKCDWSSSGEIAKCLFNSKTAFNEAKTKGVGRDTLVKFLGGNWTGHKVRTALDIIKDKNLDQEAVREIPTMEQARVFRHAVQKHKTPKPTQRKIVEKIIKDGVGRRDIPELVEEHTPITSRREKPEPKPMPMLDEVIKQINQQIHDLYVRLSGIKRALGNIQSLSVRRKFETNGKELQGLLNEIFKEEKNEEKEKTKRILCNSG